MGATFEGCNLPGGDLSDIVGLVASNLDYIHALEMGHSGQAPVGMVGAFEAEYLQILDDEVGHALGAGASDLHTALTDAVTAATLRTQRAIVERTPVDTGTAKASWTVVLPSGGTGDGVAIAPTSSHPHIDLTAAHARGIAHRVAVAQRQVRIAERSAANHARRAETRKRAREAVKRLTAATRARG